MPDLKITPVAGMDIVSADTDLEQVTARERRVFVRDAVNVNIEEGRVRMRKGLRKVCDTQFKNLWRSPAHGDTFGTLGGQWCRINPDWTYETLVTIGDGRAYHMELNQRVYVAGAAGIYVFNGNQALPATLHTPGEPIVSLTTGSLPPGGYALAVAWLRGEVESPLSNPVRLADASGLEAVFPPCFDATITGVRLYMTEPGCSELRKVADHPIGTLSTSIVSLPELGRPAVFPNKEPMPSGKFLSFWGGRILTASGSLLNFSDAFAYHIHDPRHGYIQMPQRITFLVPVRGGLWVGQIDHVAFLSGESLEQLKLVRTHTGAPLPESAIRIDKQVAGNLANDGDAVLWLSEHGYVIGGPFGAFEEVHRRKIAGIGGTQGSTVLHDKRVMTAVVLR